MADGNGIVSKHLKEFSIGGFLGGLSGGSFLFTTGGNWYHLIGEWIIRLVFTSLIALCSGLATAYAKDWYENFKKYRALKNKEYDEQKRKRKGGNGKAA